MARKPNTVQVMEDTSMDRLLARGISKLAPLFPPWIVMVLAVIAAAVFHWMWGAPATAPWAAVGLTAGTMVLTALTWVVSHERRGPIGRMHNTLTTLLAGAWVTVATITGPLAPVTRSLAVGGGAVLALSWNIRHVIREHTADGHGGDALAFLFNKTKETFGLDGAQVHTRNAGDHKIEGTLALPAGEKTVGDVQKRTDYIEGGMQLPPGAVSLAPNEDRADHAHITVSDPRVMKHPIGWPGPSNAGVSIAEPIRPGLWQDLDPVAHTIVGHHLQMMGMTGAGKSIGGCWNYLAEIITRRDVAVFAADLTKGEQTLGPLRPALHRFETTKAGVRSLIADIHAHVKARTDDLSTRGRQKWTPGCGLAYWVVWLEEFPDIGDAIDMDAFLRLLKAARSAGITIVMSLQRSDWTQMPTLARGQLAKMCFGVADDTDADFGLTDLQTKRGARPEMWQNRQPGMAYLDAPSIPDERLALPLRTWAWGSSDDDAHRNIAAHAANWPATDKTTDAHTRDIADPGSADTSGARLAAVPTPSDARHGDTDDHDHDTDPDDGDDEDEEAGDVAGEYLHTDDPNADNTAGPTDAINDAGYDEWTFDPPPPPAVDLDATQARQALRDQIAAWVAERREYFATRHLQPLLERIGRKRQWAQKEYKPLIADGLIGDYDEELGGYPILRGPHNPDSTGHSTTDSTDNDTDSDSEHTEGRDDAAGGAAA